MPNKPIQTIADLVPDQRNANRGTERGGAMIEQSLRTCGAGRSILIDKHGRVIAGNKTVENAGIIGLDNVVVVESDGTKLVAVQRTDLDLETDPRARELALFDNRAAEVNLDWDPEVVAALESEGLNLAAMFTDSEIDTIVGTTEEAVAPEEFESIGDEIATDFQCPKCGYEWSGKPK